MVNDFFLEMLRFVFAQFHILALGTINSSAHQLPENRSKRRRNEWSERQANGNEKNER